MEQVYQVLYEAVKPLDAVKSLENRPQRAEHGG
jgi:glycerol-3-phosphate dehydrogenase